MALGSILLLIILNTPASCEFDKRGVDVLILCNLRDTPAARIFVHRVKLSKFPPKQTVFWSRALVRDLDFYGTPEGHGILLFFNFSD